jgi:putative tricarboxylic transport membrane protein
MNRSGGGGNIAYAYLNQHARDPHYVLMLAPTMFTNRITGTGTAYYTDFTPLALLYNEHVFISVKADSPIRNARDLVERLRKDPTSLSIAVASAVGNHIHMGIAIPLKIAGVDVKKLKVVAFRSSAESLTALAGGHVDVAASTFGTILPHLAAGRVRVIAVSAAQRLSGVLATVPTWREQGVDTTFASWRGVVGAKGLTDAQVAYWDRVLAQATATEEWRHEVERNYWSVNYLNSREVSKYWDQQYHELEEVLGELGLAKKAN